MHKLQSAVLIAVMMATPVLAQQSAAKAGGTKLVVCLPKVLKKAVDELGPAFERNNPGVKVAVEFGLLHKVVDGVKAGKLAPDVFLSIGIRELEPLRKAGLIEVASLRKCVVTGVSILGVQGNPLKLQSLTDLTKPAVKVIAIPDPKTNSAGYAFVTAMQDLGLWDKVQAEIIRKPIPKFATELVEQNKGADVTVTYSSCYQFGHAKTTHLIAELPEEAFSPVTPAAVLMKDSSNEEVARRFMDFLVSDAGLKIWEKWGYSRIAPKGK